MCDIRSTWLCPRRPTCGLGMSFLVRVSAYLVPWATLVNLCFWVAHSLVLQLEVTETKVSLGHVIHTRMPRFSSVGALSIFCHAPPWDISAVHRMPCWPSARPMPLSFFCEDLSLFVVLSQGTVPVGEPGIRFGHGMHDL